MNSSYIQLNNPLWNARQSSFSTVNKYNYLIEEGKQFFFFNTKEKEEFFTNPQKMHDILNFTGVLLQERKKTKQTDT